MTALSTGASYAVDLQMACRVGLSVVLTSDHPFISSTISVFLSWMMALSLLIIRHV
jgi:hypothetical protein